METAPRDSVEYAAFNIGRVLERQAKEEQERRRLQSQGWRPSVQQTQVVPNGDGQAQIRAMVDAQEARRAALAAEASRRVSAREAAAHDILSGPRAGTQAVASATTQVLGPRTDPDAAYLQWLTKYKEREQRERDFRRRWGLLTTEELLEQGAGDMQPSLRVEPPESPVYRSIDALASFFGVPERDKLRQQFKDLSDYTPLGALTGGYETGQAIAQKDWLNAALQSVSALPDGGKALAAAIGGIGPRVLPIVGYNHHGPIFENPNDWNVTVDWLKQQQQGSVPGALKSADIPSIAVPWGSPRTATDNGRGLAKFIQLRPHLVQLLPKIVARMKLHSATPNRAILVAPGHRAVISRDWYGHPVEDWFLTGYEHNQVP